VDLALLIFLLPAPVRCWPVPPGAGFRADRRPPGGPGLGAGEGAATPWASAAGVHTPVMPQPSGRVGHQCAGRVHLRLGYACPGGVLAVAVVVVDPCRDPGAAPALVAKRSRLRTNSSVECHDDSITALSRVVDYS
jgi:hypothetical protein